MALCFVLLTPALSPAVSFSPSPSTGFQAVWREQALLMPMATVRAHAMDLRTQLRVLRAAGDRYWYAWLTRIQPYAPEGPGLLDALESQLLGTAMGAAFFVGSLITGGEESAEQEPFFEARNRLLRQLVDADAALSRAEPDEAIRLATAVQMAPKPWAHAKSIDEEAEQVVRDAVVLRDHWQNCLENLLSEAFYLPRAEELIGAFFRLEGDRQRELALHWMESRLAAVPSSHSRRSQLALTLIAFRAAIRHAQVITKESLQTLDRSIARFVSESEESSLYDSALEQTRYVQAMPAIMDLLQDPVHGRRLIRNALAQLNLNGQPFIETLLSGFWISLRSDQQGPLARRLGEDRYGALFNAEPLLREALFDWIKSHQNGSRNASQRAAAQELVSRLDAWQNLALERQSLDWLADRLGEAESAFRAGRLEKAHAIAVQIRNGGHPTATEFTIAFERLQTQAESLIAQIESVQAHWPLHALGERRLTSVANRLLSAFETASDLEKEAAISALLRRLDGLGGQKPALVWWRAHFTVLLFFTGFNRGQTSSLVPQPYADVASLFEPERLERLLELCRAENAMTLAGSLLLHPALPRDTLLKLRLTSPRTYAFLLAAIGKRYDVDPSGVSGHDVWRLLRGQFERQQLLLLDDFEFGVADHEGVTLSPLLSTHLASFFEQTATLDSRRERVTVEGERQVTLWWQGPILIESSEGRWLIRSVKGQRRMRSMNPEERYHYVSPGRWMKIDENTPFRVYVGLDGEIRFSNPRKDQPFTIELPEHISGIIADGDVIRDNLHLLYRTLEKARVPHEPIPMRLAVLPNGQLVDVSPEVDAADPALIRQGARFINVEWNGRRVMWGGGSVYYTADEKGAFVSHAARAHHIPESVRAAVGHYNADRRIVSDSSSDDGQFVSFMGFDTRLLAFVKKNPWLSAITLLSALLAAWQGEPLFAAMPLLLGTIHWIPEPDPNLVRLGEPSEDWLGEPIEMRSESGAMQIMMSVRRPVPPQTRFRMHSHPNPLPPGSNAWGDVPRYVELHPLQENGETWVLVSEALTGQNGRYEFTVEMFLPDGTSQELHAPYGNWQYVLITPTPAISASKAPTPSGPYLRRLRNGA